MTMQKLTRICLSGFAILRLFIVFNMLCIISTIIDMHQLCFLYTKLPIHLPAVRKSGNKHARNCVYLCKIENRS